MSSKTLNRSSNFDKTNDFDECKRRHSLSHHLLDKDGDRISFDYEDRTKSKSTPEKTNTDSEKPETSKAPNKKVADAQANLRRRIMVSSKFRNTSVDRQRNPDLPQRKLGVGNLNAPSIAQPNLLQLKNGTEFNKHKPSDLRAKLRRATVFYSSSGRPSILHENSGPSGTRALLRAQENMEMEIVKDICRKCVLRELREQRYDESIALLRPQGSELPFYKEVLFIIGIMKKRYKKLYSNIASQIGITLKSEEILRKTLFELSTSILSTKPNIEVLDSTSDAANESNQDKTRDEIPRYITWGRVFAILAITSGLSLDCIEHDHPEYINKLVDYFGEFSHEEGIIRWINSQGGWESLRVVAYATHEEKQAYYISNYNLNKLYNGGLLFLTFAFAFILLVMMIAT